MASSEHNTKSNRLDKLEKGYLIDIIVKRKLPENVIFSAVFNTRREEFSNFEIKPVSEKSHDPGSVGDTEPCRKPECQYDRLQYGFLDRQLDTSRTLMRHLEKRINNVEEINFL
ncbi:hypothetical protein HHI36_012933 [Cryptolaemus montrouzieri]|uniref:Uncharacterized protein n=1 Tax=Cryptolaemus montrouzieri TaxID=559131 RepID=A0ABD2NFW7_9CUCU